MQEELKLNYKIQSPQQRIQLVQKILKSRTPEQINNQYLQILGSYILLAKTVQERRHSAPIITDNRRISLNKRETSYQGLASKFENGEDGIFGLITNDKNILLTNRNPISEKDIADIPQLAQLVQAIKQVELAYNKATGRRRFLLKKQLIEMRQDQYEIKKAFKPTNYINAARAFNSLSLVDDCAVAEGQIFDFSLISLMDPAHISALLRNYSRLKQDAYGRFYTDGYYLIQDLETLIDSTLKENYPILFKILIYKIDGKTNYQIQNLIQQQFNIKYSQEYISCLWRQKIPKLIAEAQKKKYLTWYFTTKRKGKWKKCNRCGQIKLAHNLFFSKNTSGKDGFYSICKECRNSKKHRVPAIIKFIPYKKEEDSFGKKDMREM